MLIRRRDPAPNTLQWLAEPGSAPLRDLWGGRLYLIETWNGVPHASAETALLFMTGEATAAFWQDGRCITQDVRLGVSARASYGWPRGDLALLPPGWEIRLVPRTPSVDLLLFQAWLPEVERFALPTWVRGQDTAVTQHSSTCFMRSYIAGAAGARRLRIGTTENADGYGSYPLHSDGWQGEEIRFYDVQPEGGEAVQRLKGQYVMGQQVDAAIVVRSGDVCALPCGDTPILRVPNSSVFYVWAWIEGEQP